MQSLVPALVLSLSLATPYTPSASLQATNSATLQSESRFIVVEQGESLGSLAVKLYGDTSYWTVLWNDNDWINDSNVIEAGWKLKLRTTPVQAEDLKPSLLAKQAQRFVRVKPTTLIKQATSLPQTSQVAPVIPSTSGPLTQEQITFLGTCESGMTATRNSGNGYFGAFQFSIATWNSMKTGYERADLAPLDVQIEAVQRLLTRSSIWTQFPGCAHKMNSSGLI